MYLTQTNAMRGLTKEQYAMLREMCQYSNNLYNVALYNIRQYFFNEKRFLQYESNYHYCKTNENYGLLQAGVAQQTLKVADRSFKSFFNLVKKCKTGDYRYHDVKIPHYRKKGGYFNLILSTNAINIKNGRLLVPMSRAFSKLHGNKEILLPFPERLADKKIKEIRILPNFDGTYFKIQYCYEVSCKERTSDNGVMGIDIGVDNLASCITDNGTAFIMDGRKLKSINHYWNKQKAYYQSAADHQKQKQTHRIDSLTRKRNNRTKDIMRKSARYIVNYCTANGIGTVIAGYNPDFKRSVNIGKVNNQNFTQISFGDFRQILACLCEQEGILYIEQEESYTSKSSFLDNDILPVYDIENPYKGTFSGKRIQRGLYRSTDGTLVNADINGAANIVRKSKQNFRMEGLCKGLLASPQRIRVS